MWLALRERLWTSERRHRHGLQDRADCTLCDQEIETSEHLFARCCYTQQVWHTVSAMLNIQNATPAQEISLMDWWLQKREGFNAIKRKGLDSTFMLVSWRIWKERNDRVFSRTTEKNPAELAQVISEEVHLWCAADAKFLSTLG